MYAKCYLQCINQSTKVEKSLFRCFSIVFIFLFWKTRQVSSGYNKSSLSTACGMSLIQLKRVVDPKFNLVVHHKLLMLYPNMHFPY